MRIVRYSFVALLLSVALFTQSVYAGDAVPHRVLVGLNLFPNILSVTKGGQIDTTKRDRYTLWVVYQEDKKRAMLLAEKLTKSTKQINQHSVQVEAIAVDELEQVTHGTGFFLSEQLNAPALQQIITQTTRSGALLFSPFSGDVEAGVMMGLDVRSKIRPYLSLQSIEAAGLNCNPALVRMSRTRE